jgi:hypothetical protein
MSRIHNTEISEKQVIFSDVTTINHKMSTKNYKQTLILKLELDNPALHETQTVDVLLGAYLQSFHSLDITVC